MTTSVQYRITFRDVQQAYCLTEGVLSFPEITGLPFILLADVSSGAVQFMAPLCEVSSIMRMTPKSSV